MTPYGEIDYVQGTYHGENCNLWPARHGKDHNSSTQINYRANIWGLLKN